MFCGLHSPKYCNSQHIIVWWTPRYLVALHLLNTPLTRVIDFLVENILINLIVEFATKNNKVVSKNDEELKWRERGRILKEISLSIKP